MIPPDWQPLTQILEDIYNKYYFNRYAPKIMSLIAKLKEDNYNFYSNDVRLSYIFIEFFNLLKKMLKEIKNVRKDADYKMNMVRLVKRSLLLFFENLRFLAAKPNSLKTKHIAIFLNAFYSVESKFIEFMLFFKDEIGIRTKILKSFFNRDHYFKIFKEIKDNFQIQVGHKFEKEFAFFFEDITDWHRFSFTQLKDTMDEQAEVISYFLGSYHSIIENLFLTSMCNQLIRLVIRLYQKQIEGVPLAKQIPFDYNFYKKNIDQFVQTVNNYPINDKLSKMQNAKVLKALENFFESQSALKIDQSMYLLTFIVKERKDYKLISQLFKMKKFDDQGLEIDMEEKVNKVISQLKKYKGGEALKNKVGSGLYRRIPCRSRFLNNDNLINELVN